MILTDAPALLAAFFDFLDDPKWRAWPFNAGYGEQLLPAVARMLFVALILGAIMLFLRFLFGPNGRFRDKEMDREAEAERERERAEVQARFDKGEISEFEYTMEMKRLRS